MLKQSQDWLVTVQIITDIGNGNDYIRTIEISLESSITPIDWFRNNPALEGYGFNKKYINALINFWKI